MSLGDRSLGGLSRGEAGRPGVGRDRLGRVGLALRERLGPRRLRSRTSRSGNCRVDEFFLLLLRLGLERDLGLRDGWLDLGLRLGDGGSLLLDFLGCGRVPKCLDLLLGHLRFLLGGRRRFLDSSRLGLLLGRCGRRDWLGLLDGLGNLGPGFLGGYGGCRCSSVDSRDSLLALSSPSLSSRLCGLGDLFGRWSISPSASSGKIVSLAGRSSSSLSRRLCNVAFSGSPATVVGAGSLLDLSGPSFGGRIRGRSLSVRGRLRCAVGVAVSTSAASSPASASTSTTTEWLSATATTSATPCTATTTTGCSVSPIAIGASVLPATTVGITVRVTASGRFLGGWLCSLLL